MNSTSHSTITSAAHLSTVKDLLAKLDEMKTGKVGARERLDFLLERGPEVVQDFSFEDAFDVEARLVGERSRKLDELGRQLGHLKACWVDSPLDEDVQDAGTRLMKHLDEFVRQGQRREASTEIEMLSSLWQSEPNVDEAFGMYHTSGKSGARKRAVPSSAPAPAPAPVNKSPEEMALEATRYTLEETKKALEKELTEKNVEELEMPKAAELTPLEEEQQRIIKEAELAPKPEKEPGTQVVGQVSRKELLVGLEKPKRLERDISRSRPSFSGPELSTDFLEPPEKLKQLSDEDLERVDLLDIKTWTQALNDELMSSWKFDRQLVGRVGDFGRQGLSIFWKKGAGTEMRLDLERLAQGEVLVRLTPPRPTRGRWSLEDEQKIYRVHAVEMRDSELEELHKDPSSFVKKVLVDKPKT